MELPTSLAALIIQIEIDFVVWYNRIYGANASMFDSYVERQAASVRPHAFGLYSELKYAQQASLACGDAVTDNGILAERIKLSELEAMNAANGGALSAAFNAVNSFWRDFGNDLVSEEGLDGGDACASLCDAGRWIQFANLYKAKRKHITVFTTKGALNSIAVTDDLKNLTISVIDGPTKDLDFRQLVFLW